MYLRTTQGYGSLVRQGTVSKEAARRLRWMDHYAEHRNARLACRYFGISPQTLSAPTEHWTI
jgi:hypothetical protein